MERNKNIINASSYFRLDFFSQVPQTPGHIRPPKMTKDTELMRGPELVHNRLIYGKYGIQVRCKTCHRQQILPV
jgi:hypothetical protein